MSAAIESMTYYDVEISPLQQDMGMHIYILNM